MRCVECYRTNQRSKLVYTVFKGNALCYDHFIEVCKQGKPLYD
jgi:hypothetical protein